MKKFKAILLISLSFTGFNPYTLGLMDGPYLTFTLFKLFSFLFVFFVFPLYFISQRLVAKNSFFFVSKHTLNNVFLLSSLLSLVLFNLNNVALLSLVNFMFFIIMAIILFNFLETLNVHEFLEILLNVLNIFFYITLINVVSYYIFQIDTLSIFYSFDSTSMYPHFHAIATEPSHAAFIILSSYLAYVILSKRNDIYVSRKVHLIVLFMVVFFQSTFGYLLYIGILIYLFSEKYYQYRHLMLPILFGLLILTSDMYIAYFEKLQGLYDLIITLDYDKSNYARIRTMALITLLNDYPSIELYNQIFGHGIGSSEFYVLKISDDLFSDGQFANFLYDFGIFGCIIIFTFIFINFSKCDIYISLYILILLIFNANISSQMYWWVLLMLFSLKIFENKFSKNYAIDFKQSI